ncbi:MAG TPA: class Ib ribonucleoside-diphosphate reductase assembly flavoprotein NrdI [Sphingobacteriaceae bacterium]|nr:class Ib ribonucleoside-diphosphate reductase assembly flavoprotein NrdI [Sphingobacteriaceae bacterium]
MERIYYDSRTGNVARFIEKVKEATGWEFCKIDADQQVFERGHLITFTTRFGEIPESTRQFLTHSGSYMDSVSSSGNRNWGRNFGVAADQISTNYGIPIVLKFELSGTQDDVAYFINHIKEKNYDDNRHRQELDSTQ